MSELEEEMMRLIKEEMMRQLDYSKGAVVAVPPLPLPRPPPQYQSSIAVMHAPSFSRPDKQ